MEGKSTRAHEIPRSHRLKHISLADWLARTQSREQALWMAHTQSGMSLTAMAAELGLSVSRVSQLVKRAESKTGEELSNEISRKQVPQKDTRQ
jgi:DNA-directed RNA polymerase specialized sigma subunit